MTSRSFALSFALAAAVLVGRAGPARAEEPPPAAPAQAAPKRHSVGPWVLVGIGAGVAALGVLSFVGAVKAHNDVNSEAAAKHCSLNPIVCPPGVDASTLNTNATGGKAMDIIGGSFTAAGGAAVAGGLIWHFLEPVGAPPVPAGLRISPWVGRGGGLVVQAAF